MSYAMRSVNNDLCFESRGLCHHSETGTCATKWSTHSWQLVQLGVGWWSTAALSIIQLPTFDHWTSFWHIIAPQQLCTFVESYHYIRIIYVVNSICLWLDIFRHLVCCSLSVSCEAAGSSGLGISDSWLVWPPCLQVWWFVEPPHLLYPYPSDQLDSVCQFVCVWRGLNLVSVLAHSVYWAGQRRRLACSGEAVLLYWACVATWWACARRPQQLGLTP